MGLDACMLQFSFPEQINPLSNPHVRHTHLHGGQVASMGSSKPAVSGALVDIYILQINVHSHHTPARQEDIMRTATEVVRKSVQSILQDIWFLQATFSNGFDFYQVQGNIWIHLIRHDGISLRLNEEDRKNSDRLKDKCNIFCKLHICIKTPNQKQYYNS